MSATIVIVGIMALKITDEFQATPTSSGPMTSTSENTLFKVGSRSANVEVNTPIFVVIELRSPIACSGESNTDEAVVSKLRAFGP